MPLLKDIIRGFLAATILLVPYSGTAKADDIMPSYSYTAPSTPLDRLKSLLPNSRPPAQNYTPVPSENGVRACFWKKHEPPCC